MTKFKEWKINDAIDLIVGGTPCQAFSVAGLRKGLDDPRGNLTLVFLGIVQHFRPKWVVWENVPGVLSERSGAFGSFLGGLGQLGYGWAYRILDAQYFGVAQRRRRVFVVGHLGAWQRAAAVLFEPSCLRGDSAPSRETREDVAATVSSSTPSRRNGGSRPTEGHFVTVTGTLSSRALSGGGLGTDFECAGGLVPWPAQVSPTLNATSLAEKGALDNQHINGGGGYFVLGEVPHRESPAERR